MTVITIPTKEYKEYRKVIDDNRKLRNEFSKLYELVVELARDELKPSVVRRLTRLSSRMDQGKGIRFSSLKEAQNYLRRL